MRGHSLRRLAETPRLTLGVLGEIVASRASEAASLQVGNGSASHRGGGVGFFVH